MKFTAITQTKHEGDNSIMREGYTSQAKKALAYAVRTAEKCGHNYVGTEHLLIGLLNVEDGTAGMVLSEFHVDAGQLTELIDRLIAPGGNTVTESRPGYTPRVRRVLENAEAEAARFKSRAVGTEHLLIAILKESDCVATRLLFTMGINIQKLYGAILTAMGEAPLQGGASGNANTGRGPQTRGGAQTSETPALDQYSRDLTELAREGKLDPVVGRGQEIERVIQILSRRTKNNPCLIGEPGVGKTAIAEGLAQRIALGIVPETIRDKRVVVLDLSGMVAGSKYRGEFEERIKRVVKEVTDNENILLFIDELHTIIGAGGAEGALDASNILKPSLSRGEIQLIGATTLEEYRKYIEKDAALERRFQPVKVEEPTESEALDILKGLRPYYERHHGVEITDEALEAAVKMSVRYINDRFLPDKAIDLVDEASAGVQLAGYQVPDNMTKEEQVLFAPETRRFDVRIIAIADDNLYKKVEKGTFLRELFHLLSASELQTVPIRRRREDIPDLLNYFLLQFFHNTDMTCDRIFSEGLLRFLKEYAYPGNIHELYNLSCSLFTRYSSHKLQLSDLPTYLRSRQMADVSLTDLQYQVLSFVSTHPKAGRLAIKNGLADGETFVSEAALRTVLGELSSAGYLIVHRTKGGCEISELGRMVLEK